MTHRRGTFLKPGGGVPQRRRRHGGPVLLHEVARQPWRFDTHRTTLVIRSRCGHRVFPYESGVPITLPNSARE
jgi:hypothetical protein